MLIFMKSRCDLAQPTHRYISVGMNLLADSLQGTHGIIRGLREAIAIDHERGSDNNQGSTEFRSADGLL